MKSPQSFTALSLSAALAVGLVLLFWTEAGQRGGHGNGELLNRSENPAGTVQEQPLGSQAARLAAPIVKPGEESLLPAFKVVAMLPEPYLPKAPWEEVQTPAATRMVNGTAVIDPQSWRDLTQLQPGERLSLPTLRGALRATVMSRQQHPAEGKLWIAGKLGSLSAGTFAFYRDEATGFIGGEVLDHLNRKAYQIIQHEDGRTLLQERPLEAVICAGMPREPKRFAAPASNAVYNVVVPALDSLPSATAVLYIDFDGETVTDPRWNGGETIVALPAVMGGQPITPQQITEVWAAVAEDFAPFNVSVTTIASRYANAPLARRMRCIQTPTNDAAPSAGGVAYLESFSLSGNYSADIPCWSFNSGDVNVMAMTISHELGHTVGLIHDGLGPPLGNQEYYGGHGTNPTGWGAIMGAPFGMLVTQWSKGEYYAANNTEDDLAVITRPQNFPFRTDEAGGTRGTASNVSDLLLGQLNERGILSDPADVDMYRFTTAGGAVQIQGQAPALPEANIDVKLRLLNSTGVEVAVSDPAQSLAAVISANLAAGEYFIEVSGSSWGTPLSATDTVGWTSYGSRGQYLIAGSFPPLPALPVFTQQPLSPPAPILEGRPVSFVAAAISNVRATYQWFKVVGGISSPVNGARSPTLRISAVNATHIADYFLRVTNSEGFVDSDLVTLEVVLKPRIATPLAATLTLASGSPLSLAPVLTGTAPMAVQWFKNGKALVGQTGTTLDFAALAWADEGTYHYTVSNAAGSLKSGNTRLTVQSVPLFLSLPALFAVPLNGKATLVAQVGGSPTLRYQWTKDGMDIPGATSPKLNLNGLPATAGMYALRVTNNFGVETSSPTTVVVDARLRITQHPLGGSFTRGDAISLSVVTEGDEPITYQWQFNGVDIPGATARIFDIPSATWFNNGSYRVVIQNRVSKVTSKSATLRISSRPEFVLEPVDAKAARGGTHAFVANAVGTPRIRYQWFKDGSPLPGATSSRLSLRNLDTANEGDYHVVATNDLGFLASATASLVVEDAPRILTQPLAGFFPVGGNVAANVQTSGAPLLQYQWQRNRRDIPGQTNAALTLPGATLANSGKYRVVVTNDVGKVFSREVSLTVQVAPNITVPPTDQTIFEGETAVLSVTATGTAALRYRWLLNGTEVSKARTLTLKDARADKQGSYVVEVSNLVGTVTSTPITLTINPVPAPTIARLIPLQLRPGEKFALTGSNLQFTRSLKVGGRSVSFVKLPGNQIVGTIPTSFTSGGAVVVTTLGGTSQAPNSLSVSGTATNDLFVNSRVVTGSKILSTTINIGYTIETNEPYPNRRRSAWWRWVAPTTGRYELTTEFSDYDTILAAYQGDDLAGLTFVGANDDDPRGGRTSRLNLSAVQGVTYRFVVDVFSATDEGGFTRFTLNPLPSSAPIEGEIVSSKAAAQPLALLPDSDQVSSDAAPQPGGSETVPDLELSAEEGGDIASSFVWRSKDHLALAGASSVTCSFEASLAQVAGGSASDDAFAWTFYGTDQQPLVALVLNALNGQWQVINAAGESTALEGQMQPDSLVGLELTADFKSGSWSLSLDGAVTHGSLALPMGAIPELQDVVMQANRGGSDARARLLCRHLKVTTQPSKSEQP